MLSGTAVPADLDGRLATRVWLHVAALCAVAIAQPLLDLLGGSPEFFVAHHAGAIDILLLTAGLILVLPAVLTAAISLVGLAGARPRSAILGAVVAGLVFVLVMPLVKQAGIAIWPVAMPLSVALGVAGAIAYSRLAVVRSFLTVLSIAILVVPAVFLARPEIRSFLGRSIRPAADEADGSGSGAASTTTPVVMIIFDELPVLSLLDADRQIDPVLYPNFAALARDGVWFRNATTVHDFTRWAVPSIVSGKYPRGRALPDAVDHPDTLFTMLDRTHRLEVTEAVTQLCPETLCKDRERASLGARLSAIARDLRLVFLLRVLTDDLTAGLPDVTTTWARFDGSLDQAAPDSTSVDAKSDDDDRAEIAADVQRRWRDGMGASRMDPILRFIDEIEADDPQPTFYFLHTLISHTPYHMLPGGKENTTWAAIPGGSGGRWVEGEPWAVSQQYQRHLLQVGFVDGIVGRVVKRLKDVGLYDRALIVMTADHGKAFLPGVSHRFFARENAAEIMGVPLIFKFPDGMGSHGVDDTNAETTDIVPTIADALGLVMEWQPDGASLRDRSRPERQTKTMFSRASGRKRLQPGEPAMSRPLARKLALFGDGAQNAHRAPHLAPFDGLVGRPLTALRIADGGGAVEILRSSAYENIDPSAEELPFDIAGRFGSPRPDTFLAVAVNGVVEAVTRTWESNARGWLATPRLDVWRPGANDLQVFVVETDPEGLLLRSAVVGLQRPPDLNLILESTRLDWGVRRAGFFPTEKVSDGREFRWTRAVAEISNAFSHRRPLAVEVDVITVPGGVPKNLKIEANDCTLFEGVVGREWSATLSLEHCDLPPDDFTLRFTSDAPRGKRDRRQLGVGLSRVVLR